MPGHGHRPRIEAEYHDEVARDEEALGRPSEARGELERAVALDPTAERRFRLSQLAERLGDHEEARRQLEAAVAAEPGNMEYKAALAYALRNSGDLARRRAASVQRTRLPSPTVMRSMKISDTPISAWAKTTRRSKNSNGRSTTSNSTLPKARRSARPLRGRWKGCAGPSMLSSRTGQHTATQTFALPAIIANAELGISRSLISTNQGGLEIDYQPPKIGYVDGRIFQAFARTFFSYAPGTISPQGDSFQGGVGIHYKPLRDYNFVLSGERLIKFGANAVNNWEGRVSFSTSTGYEVDPVASNSWYNLLYIDLAATAQSPHQILTYADGRSGINFNAR